MFEHWDWTDTASVILVAAILAFASLAGAEFTADHQVVNYELYQNTGSVCVRNIRNWAPNDTAFCGSPENAISVYLALKNQLHKKSNINPPRVLAPNEVEL